MLSITYDQLLDTFWKNIDPTVQDRQFCDVGSQYRSAIFTHNEEQARQAEESKEALIKSGRFATVYTEIVPAGRFYSAEEYHQDFYQKSPWRYKWYRYSCGRDGRLEELWGDKEEK